MYNTTNYKHHQLTYAGNSLWGYLIVNSPSGIMRAKVQVDVGKITQHSESVFSHFCFENGLNKETLTIDLKLFFNL